MSARLAGMLSSSLCIMTGAAVDVPAWECEYNLIAIYRLCEVMALRKTACKR